MIILLAVTIAFADYSRLEGSYTVKSGGNCYDVANAIGSWTNSQEEFVAKEISILNKCDLGTYHNKDDILRVPRYIKTEKFICGDVRNWYYAVKAAEIHGVSPGLLVAIRTHENPKKSRDGYGYGVKIAKDLKGDRNKALSLQAWWSAKIIKRVSTRQKWNPKTPLRKNVSSLGRAYAQGSNSWGKSVWILYRRAKRIKYE